MTQPQESLSVVLPSHQGAANLSSRVAELLEFLPELTHDYDVLVLAYSDLSEEVAVELAREYPQLRVLRPADPEVPDDFRETAIRHTTSELVILLHEEVPIFPSRLKQLWSLRAEPMQPAESAGGARLVDRLQKWASQVTIECNDRQGIVMLRRSLTEIGSKPSPSFRLWSGQIPSPVSSTLTSR